MRRIALFFLQLLVVTSALASPRVTFEATSITISGVSSKGGIYVFGVAREPRGDYTDVVSRETTLFDDDADGTVNWELSTEVALQSIWVAVDLNSGSATVATPPGYEAVSVTLTDEQ